MYKLRYAMGYEQGQTDLQQNRRRTKGTRQRDVERGCDREARCSGAQRPHDALGDFRETGAGSTTGCDAYRGGTSGGVITQLLSEERERLVCLDEELERLHQSRLALVDRIEYLEQMLVKLREIVAQNNTPEGESGVVL